jgi:hypothetical protein
VTRHRYLAAALAPAVVALYLGTLSSEAATVTVTVASGRAAPGSDVAIPISLKGAPGIDAMHVEIAFDEGLLVPKSVEKGPMLSGNAMMAFNASLPGRLIAGFTSMDPVQGDGVVLIAHFTARGRPFKATVLLPQNVRAWVQGPNHQNYFIGVVADAGRFTVGLPLWMWIATALVIIAIVILIARRKRTVPSAQPARRQVAAAAAVGSGSTSKPAGRVFCRSCAAEIMPTARFCTKCGASVG